MLQINAVEVCKNVGARTNTTVRTVSCTHLPHDSCDVEKLRTKEV